jgi:hypothetical protein
MRRIPEGALRAERTPVNLPSAPRLVPLAPPPPTHGLGRPETTRKETRWERAITWLLSRGEDK